MNIVILVPAQVLGVLHDTLGIRGQPSEAKKAGSLL